MNIKQKNNKVNLLLLVIGAIGIMGAISWGILQVLGEYQTRYLGNETK